MAPFAGRYVLREALKSGNGVDTFRAVDTATSTDVVVKTIAPDAIHAAARLRFEHEMQVLGTLSGSGLPGLVDSGLWADQLFLVQPLVPGRTLADLLTAGPLTPSAGIRVAHDLAVALEVAHGAGICHRDVKPANVIVEGRDPVERVTLIDFGFARSPWLDESIRDDLVGTVRYLAPEAAGMLAVPADERSDLYSVGVVLFECLTGRPPFPGPTVGDLLRQHLSMPVPALAEVVPGLPRALGGILERLLRKEPAERYQSAAALGYDLACLLDALEAGETDPRLLVGRRDQRRSLTDPAFVGRDAELASLLALVSTVKEGGGGLVLLEADSGGGKSRLLNELTVQAADRGVLVLRGQGVAQAAQRPFTLLHGVAQDLAAALPAGSPGLQSLRDRVGDSAGGAVRALPSLGSLFDGPAEDDLGPEQFGEQRSLAALAHLLASIPADDRPTLLVLDDCQWADRLTVRLLAEVYGPDAEAPPFLGVIAAFRSEEVAEGHALRAIAQGKAIQLGPLPPASMRQLAESMAGPVPDVALDTVVRLADGSPFMGSAVMRGLVECGALVNTPAGWAVDELALEDVQAARRSAAFLVRRLELLSPAALKVLSVGAVLGKAFDILVAVELADEGASGSQILEEARGRRLLWVDDRTGRCSFFHDKIREALLDRLEPAVRNHLHGQAADALLREHPDVSPAEAFDVAFHLDAAGRCATALPFAMLAAEEARRLHGLDAAVANYRIAERGVASDDVAMRARIAEGLGDVLTLQGVYVEAEAQLAAARGLVDDRMHSAALEGKLGDLAFKQGDVPTARRHLEGAMAGLGRPVPRRAPTLVLALIWELLVQAVHTLLPRLTTGRRDRLRGDEDHLAMRIYSRLAYLYWFHSGKVTCGWAHLRGLNLAERYPPSAELGQAYSEHAPVMTMIPWFSRGLRYAQRSLAIRRELGDVWGQGQSLGFAGVLLYAASRYGEGEGACREALRLLEQTGDRWEANTAGWNLALCLYRRGELPEATAVARDVYASAVAIGDPTSAGVALSVWTRSSGGDVDPALIAAELAGGSEDASTTTELHLAAALVALRHGDLPSADEHLTQAAATIKAAGLRQEYVAPVSAWRATTARLRAEGLPLHDTRGRARALRGLRRAGLVARWWAMSYRNNGPHALREAGLCASLSGRPRRAHRALRKSLLLAERQGAAYEAALTRLATAEIMQARGGVRDAEPERAAVAALEVAGSQQPVDDLPTVSLFDRFTTLLAVGRTITAASSADALESAVRDAALALLRGERCHLVRVGPGLSEELTSVSGESVDEVSGTLVARAVNGGVPVVVDVSADESESLLLSGIRSVLAAPIVVDGDTPYCFYVTHRQIGQLFGDEEIQLAAFIATLAGAAYEHLAGAESRFRSLAQNSSDVLTLVNADGLVTYQSSAAGRVFALPSPGLVGRPITAWVHPDDLTRFDGALHRAVPGGELRIECRFQHADGSYRHTESAVTNLLDDPTVGALVINTRDVTERRRLEDELRERALHDPLTGLPNRALFLERAQHALDGRGPRPLVACFLDLDDFKAVNDSQGHGVGDELLQEMARRLGACLRPQDTVARFGGDEFAILLEDTQLAAALVVVGRILEATAAPVTLGHVEVLVHASIGVAAWETRNGSPDDLLAEADAAMYAAKGRGGHAFEVFHPDMRLATEVRSRARLELDRALGNEEFRLHFQPIVEIGTGRHVGLEALVRWQHPERGLLAPADFIDHAEESGQIAALGEWVLTTACRAGSDLPPDMRISVNVSPRQLQRADLVGLVARALSASGLPAHRLVLEITETASVADVDVAIARLAEIKALGVLVALDDFGTGYSPLSYLRRFPIDYLKIDRSFVQGLVGSDEDRAIVRSVIDMANALGVLPIAEGVELAEQRDVLQELGCQLGQGYLWARPAPLAMLPPQSLPAPRRPLSATVPGPL
ncbi:MAG: EAL domain-containing protein [Actinomycetota bacterium]|nr:EAL domain-containing protein [Actinomycetota bacterium]